MPTALEKNVGLAARAFFWRLYCFLIPLAMSWPCRDLIRSVSGLNLPMPHWAHLEIMRVVVQKC